MIPGADCPEGCDDRPVGATDSGPAVRFGSARRDERADRDDLAPGTSAPSDGKWGVL